jgi:hypothetical protein
VKQGAPKKKRKKTGVPTYLPFLRFFEIFRSDFRNIVVVFLGSSCRETAKNAIKENRWGKTTGKKFFFLNFFRPKVFDIYFPKKVFNGIFELPLFEKKSQN